MEFSKPAEVPGLLERLAEVPDPGQREHDRQAYRTERGPRSELLGAALGDDLLGPGAVGGAEERGSGAGELLQGVAGAGDLVDRLGNDAHFAAATGRLFGWRVVWRSGGAPMGLVKRAGNGCQLRCPEVSGQGPNEGLCRGS
jgi:hypothetical protein